MTPPSSAVILRELYHEIQSKPVFMQRLGLLQDRLRIGWGTARVAVGMSVTASIYDSEAAGGGKLGRSNVQEEVLMPFNRFRFNPGFQRTELGTTSINTWREVSMGLMLGVF
ncbi:hypothetical protein VYU27_007780 [Nannochloropsis oceanica]